MTCSPDLDRLFCVLFGYSLCLVLHGTFDFFLDIIDKRKKQRKGVEK